MQCFKFSLPELSRFFRDSSVKSACFMFRVCSFWVIALPSRATLTAESEDPERVLQHQRPKLSTFELGIFSEPNPDLCVLFSPPATFLVTVSRIVTQRQVVTISKVGSRNIGKLLRENFRVF